MQKDDDGAFAPLRAVLESAVWQAEHGKGKERHNPHRLPFAEQPIMTITRAVGPGFPLGQAAKKITEVAQIPDRTAKIEELQGAIVYLAAAILWYQEQEAADAMDE